MSQSTAAPPCAKASPRLNHDLCGSFKRCRSAAVAAAERARQEELRAAEGRLAAAEAEGRRLRVLKAEEDRERAGLRQAEERRVAERLSRPLKAEEEPCEEPEEEPCEDDEAEEEGQPLPPGVHVSAAQAEADRRNEAGRRANAVAEADARLQRRVVLVPARTNWTAAEVAAEQSRTAMLEDAKARARARARAFLGKA